MPLGRDAHDDSRSGSNMQTLAAPSWTSSTSYTSPRRPFAIGETPSSPSSSTASQKFEVKRLLSRPAPAACSSRPLTLVSTTTPSTDSDLQPTIKRSNSLGRGFLKRRPSKTQEDATTPKARHVPLDAPPSMPSYTEPASTTPASAYARAYAQRTQMSSGTQIDSHLPPSSADREPRRARSKSRPRAPSEPAEGRARHPFEPVPADSDELVPTLALAGAGPASAPKKPADDSFGRGLTRKVSARFRRRKNSNPGAGIMSDGEADIPIRSQSRRRNTGKEKESQAVDWNEWEAGRLDWSREKERANLRGIGFTGLGSNTRSPVVSVSHSTSSSPRLVDHDATMRPSRMSRKRLSRHLSIEDFSGLARVEKEMGATFEMWEPKTSELKPPVGPEADMPRKRSDSISRKERTRRDLAAVQEKEREKQLAATVGRSGIKSTPMVRAEPPLFRKDDLHTIYKESSPTPSLKGEPSSKRSTMIRSDSMPSESARPTNITSPESRKENKIWRLVKKMSTGTLKEKRSYQTEKAPPVPPLPNSRRSSVHDYGEEIRSDLSRFGREASSATNSIHSGPSSLSGHATVSAPQPQPQPSRHRSASGGRPSLSHEWRPSMTNDSAPSTSPKSSFGRPQSPRTSMSSYVDVGEDVPPLPLGKHIVSPVELAQAYTPTPREREPLSTTTNNTGVGASPSLPPPKRPRATPKSRDKSTPLSSPAPSAAAPVKPKPNVLRRPTRLNADGLSPRPVSTAAASPRSPRSASMGLPSPRPRAQTQTQDQLPPRPRSNSLGTVFTFREMGNTEKSKLTEQEKVAKFEQLLEASEKAGGTLHARLHDRVLLSDTMRLSANFDGASVVSGL